MMMKSIWMHNTFVSTAFCKILGNRLPARQLHLTLNRLAVEKSLLAKLRKKTGFSLSQCKKALENHNNDIEKAEEWIKKEAQSQGWSKAVTLSSRPVSQGLIGVHITGNTGAIVEVNCETDFVARNEQFQGLVCKIAEDYASFGINQEISNSLKHNNTKEELEILQTSDGKSLGDKIALTIGTIGENMTLTRGSFMRSPPSTDIVSYSHPSTIENPKQFGKYGSLVVVKNLENNPVLCRELCAHIVGMNPTEIGSMDDYLASFPTNIDSEAVESSTESSSSAELSTESSDTSSAATESSEKTSDTSSASSDSSDTSSEEEYIPVKRQKEDSRLLFQDFLSDPGRKVGDVLQESDIEVIDFIRFERGETVKVEN